MGNTSSFKSNFDHIEADLSKLINEIDTVLKTSSSDNDSQRIKKKFEQYLKNIKDHNRKIRHFFEEEHNGIEKIVDDFAMFKDDTTRVANFVSGYSGDNRESQALLSKLRPKAAQLKDKANALQHQIIEKFPDAAKSIDKRIKEIETARKAEYEKDEDEDDD